MSTAEKEMVALAVIEPQNIQTVFTTPNGLDPILQKIAAEARSFVADVNTPSGRKSIAAIAFKVAKTKTYLDGLGKDLVDGLKDLPRKVDANRKSVRDFLDELKDEVRRPLTEWEQEQERIEAARVAKAEADRLAREVDTAHELAILLNADFDRKKVEEREAAERAKREREEQIAREAAERVRIEAEELAKREKEASLRREVEAQLAAQRAEREKEEAIQRAKDAEARAERERAEAVKREEEARIQAVRNEQARVAEVERIAKLEQERREADKEHRRKINSEAAAGIVALGFDDNAAKELIKSIANGKIKHVSIAY
jgi:colicin import membrane protein